MARPEKFTLIYSPDFENQLDFIDPKYYSLIRGKIEEQLQFEPDVATRNRKPLRSQTVLAAK
jgi:mRNA-degrading endonuclease RelE of RelBE toxin-antitoxin system